MKYIIDRGDQYPKNSLGSDNKSRNIRIFLKKILYSILCLKVLWICNMNNILCTYSIDFEYLGTKVYCTDKTVQSIRHNNNIQCSQIQLIRQVGTCLLTWVGILSFYQFPDVFLFVLPSNPSLFNLMLLDRYYLLSYCVPCTIE